jgi:mannan polymerase II complex MNN11 subunit
MHLALPARKSSNPTPYVTRTVRLPVLRRSRVQAILLGVCALGAVLFIISRIFGASDSAPLGTPPVVIVTVLDLDNYSTEYISNIRENRIEYAKKHGRLECTRLSCLR